MTKEKENMYRGNADNCYELFCDLFKAFKESKVFTEGEGNKHFAFDIMCGIALFTGAILKGLAKSSDSGDALYKFYTEQLLPDSYAKSEELFGAVSTFTVPLEEQEAS